MFCHQLFTLRLVIHDWERPYYKEGAKSLGYTLEKEVKHFAFGIASQAGISSGAAWSLWLYVTHFLSKSSISLQTEHWVQSRMWTKPFPGKGGETHRGSGSSKREMKIDLICDVTHLLCFWRNPIRVLRSNWCHLSYNSVVDRTTNKTIFSLNRNPRRVTFEFNNWTC